MARRHAVAIAILSYDGQISFGLPADPDLVPDLDRLAGQIESAAAAAGSLPSTVS